MQSVKCGEHDDRKGHHYYTTPFARPSCIVVMTLAVIMLRKKMNRTHAVGAAVMAALIDIATATVNHTPVPIFLSSTRMPKKWTEVPVLLPFI